MTNKENRHSSERIRLGIWGVGRGSNFIASARALDFEVVAGCDCNRELLANFSKTCPEAATFEREEDFLAFPDMDAVLIATFFTDHARHAIKALERGLHVMSEVTSFFTPAEGVQLVEAVEKSGKVYHLLENYPFSKENMYLASLWDEGFFGEFQYGEFEYLHECRSLCYCYCGMKPVEPGNTVHAWRSWLDFHYYNTHSLGPLMQITKLRPVSITALPEAVPLPGYPANSGMAKPCPSLIQMSNGGVMRNLCGATTSDYHTGKRLWGTLAAAESLGRGLQLTIGGSGGGTRVQIEPQWPCMAEEAEKGGHGGGDFWELYYFAREIRHGEPGPWNIYAACDVTLAGIMAARSSRSGGQVMEIPDFRDPAIRERYREDHWSMEKPFDIHQVFPEEQDPKLTGQFSRLIMELEKKAVLLRTVLAGRKIYKQIKNADAKLVILQKLSAVRQALPQLEQECALAAELIQRYDPCPATEALRGIFTLLGQENIQDFKALEQLLQRYEQEMLQ